MRDLCFYFTFSDFLPVTRVAYKFLESRNSFQKYFKNENISAIAISSRSENKKITEAIGPCGACRQSLAEYEQKQKSPIAVYFMGETGKIVKVASVMDLLPLEFDAKYL